MYIYIYTICMKFISFFIHNINSIKMKKNIFSIQKSIQTQ